MSILIKNVKMPKSCDECPCSYWTDGVHHNYCQAVGYDTEIHYGDKGRPQWCPLVELPPHGRLGDLDRLERMFADIDNAPYSGFDGEEPFYSADDAAQIIRLSPTIIPTEEDEP